MNAVNQPTGKIEPVAAPAPEAPPKRKRRRRRPLRLILMLALPVAMAAVGLHFWLAGGRYESTDNAYLQQPKVQIAAEEAGRVVEVDIADDRRVKAGDVLFRIDPEPYRITLAQAEAALAEARIGVEQLRAGYSRAQAEARSAASEVAYLQTQLHRQQDLSQKGVTTASALDEAERNLQKAEQAKIAADQAVAAALAALGGDPTIETADHPNVLAALATREKAKDDLAKTVITAPADGVVAQAASFRTGQYVSKGSPLFALVETHDSWVNANFKETQIEHFHVGQSAKVTLDTYPDKPIDAVIESIGAGTGAEFSLLPAENATGNWVKVTQRVPVRLKLMRPADGVVLRTGMSATAVVDTKVSRNLADLAPFPVAWLGVGK